MRHDREHGQIQGRGAAVAVVREIRPDAKAAKLHRIVVEIILRDRRTLAPAPFDVGSKG